MGVLPHFACCRDGKVFCKPLNKLAIFGMWQERLAHTELNKRCRCKFRFHINDLYFPTACRQHAKCGRTSFRGPPHFLVAATSIASTIVDAHDSATSRRYFSATLETHPALTTKS